MKKYALTKTFYGVILSTLILLPATSSAIDLFDTSTGYLVIPEVDVNGDTFFDDVTLKLDFATGTFEFVSATPKSSSISATPIDTMEEQDIKMDFMGCERSGRNEVTCHLNLTSLGGFDRSTQIVGRSTAGSASINGTKLYDDLGNTYIVSETVVGNIRSLGGNITQNLIAGIPTLAKFKFTNVSPNSNSLSLFQPVFITGGVLFSGDFRDINF